VDASVGVGGSPLTFLSLVREVAADAATQSDPDTCLRHLRTGLIRLGFSRAGIWVTDRENPELLRGTWGTDWDGSEIDEHDLAQLAVDFHGATGILRGEAVVTVRVAMGGAAVDDEEAGDLKPTHIGFAVAEKHLMVATDVRLLERVLRGVEDAETLADSAAFKRIARKYPDQTSAVSFSRRDSQLKQIYELLQQGRAGMLAGGPFDSFDFSKMPDLDALKKYMPPTGGFMERDERGLKITSFSLRNEAD
jgi:hypothetical protein